MSIKILNKVHAKDPSYYPRPSIHDGDIGLCGMLWCKVAAKLEDVTCKRCLKKLENRTFEVKVTI